MLENKPNNLPNVRSAFVEMSKLFGVGVPAGIILAFTMSLGLSALTQLLTENEGKIQKPAPSTIKLPDNQNEADKALVSLTVNKS